LGYKPGDFGAFTVIKGFITTVDRQEMTMNKALKQYVKLVEQYGMTVEQGGKHFRVLKKGNLVATLSTSGETNAMRQSIRDLARKGHFGKDEKRARMVKFG
jgi:hypothetical protein